MGTVDVNRERQRPDNDNGDDEEKFRTGKHGRQITKGRLNGW